MNLGSWNIDDLLTFTVNTHTTSGAQSDADSVPTYRIYEDETTTPILTGSMAKLDDANTTGFYSEQITLSAANGFEAAKSYTIRITATVGGTTATTLRTLQIGASVNVQFIDGQDQGQDLSQLIQTWTTSGFSKSLSSGAAQGGTSTSITLAAGDSATDNIWVGASVLVRTGTGTGQQRVITAYNGTTKVATVDRPWQITPDNTSAYSVYLGSGSPLPNILKVVQAIRG